MLSKVNEFLHSQHMLEQGDSVVCAVSGGADSVAMLFAFYLLKDKWRLSLSAAHFNHHLRGEESNRDEAFVRSLCDRLDIPLTVGEGNIVPGEKGLEAAAREARYAFLRTLPGKIATAHTADDNAETVLMHLLRGTGLKGLGGITPVHGRIIRPMLTVTRQEVENFLEEYCLRHIEDSSNGTEDFLRNRIRHNVVPLLKAENPSFAIGTSRMALRLRQDEEFLSSLLETDLPPVSALRKLHPALRSRYLERFLKQSGIPEPEQSHLRVAEELVFSDKPSARANFPGGVRIARSYDTLIRLPEEAPPEAVMISTDGMTELPEWGIRITCTPASEAICHEACFTCRPEGKLIVRSRQSGDKIRLSGGSKDIKKLFIDRKIPADRRPFVPILADEQGVLAIAGIGANLNRAGQGSPAILVTIEKL